MSKITLLTLVLAGLMTISSCSKEDDDDGSEKNHCEMEKYGTVRVINNPSDAYRVKLYGIGRDELFPNHYETTLIGQTFIDIRVKEGANREFYAHQRGGFVLYPTESKTYISVVRCEEYQWEIP